MPQHVFRDGSVERSFRSSTNFWSMYNWSRNLILRQMGFDEARRGDMKPRLGRAFSYPWSRAPVRLESSVKTSGSFTTRFDQEPALTHSGQLRPEWQAGARQAYVLRLPKEAMPQFLNDARTSKTLMFRHEFGGIPVDVHYDLAGFDKEFAPLAEACGIGSATPRQATAAPKGSRPVAQPDRQVGSWLVRESVSTVDDKLIVVVHGLDTLKKVDMYIRCRESAVEAFFVQTTGVFMADKAENVTIDVSLDGDSAVRHKGPTTPLNKAAFVNDGRAFVSGWRAGRP